MHLDLVRDPARRLPVVAHPTMYRSARLWHCKYMSLRDVAALSNVETLVVASWPDPDFDALAELSRLRDLRILHFSKVSRLSPLGRLVGPKTLSLASSPGWDASGKAMTVRSLEPLGRLPRLRHLELLGVRPVSGALDALLPLKSLHTVRLSGYAKAETKAYYQAAGVADDFAPEPEFAT